MVVSRQGAVNQTKNIQLASGKKNRRSVVSNLPANPLANVRRSVVIGVEMALLTRHASHVEIMREREPGFTAGLHFSTSAGTVLLLERVATIILALEAVAHVGGSRVSLLRNAA
jgi:hypothetical protein